MTRGEKRRARKTARGAGRPLAGELAVDEHDDRDGSPIEFTESPAGYRARERWARWYDGLNGAPEGDWDR